jgi:hypothetical protein
VSERGRETRRVLDLRRASVSFPDTPLLEAIAFFQDVSGLNVAVSGAAREWAETSDFRIRLRLRDIRLRSLLDLMLDGTELGYGIRHDVLYIDRRDAFPAEVRLVIYDVSDLVHQPPDFPAPRLGLGTLPDTRP